jgi:hypothetical protein
MILCRYFDAHGLDTLKDLRLKVSSLKQFNDPFENSPFMEGNQIAYKSLKDYFKSPETIDRLYRTHRDAIGGANKREFKRILRAWDKRDIYDKVKTSLPEALRDTIREQVASFSDLYRVLCFSRLDKIKPHEEILMWSHYSAGHTGLRVSFDTSKFTLRSRSLIEVTYQQERVRIELSKLAKFDDSTLRDFSHALTVKSSGWAYECEYRWIIDKRECFTEETNTEPLDFIALPPEAVIRVDVGARSSTVFHEEVRSSLILQRIF